MLIPHPQKFRAYLLDSDKGMDVMAYLLCYGLEIKDKPGGSHLGVAVNALAYGARCHRATWDVSCTIVHGPELVC